MADSNSLVANALNEMLPYVQENKLHFNYVYIWTTFNYK